MIEFSKSDLQQLVDKGISIKTVKDQIHIFQEGIPFVTLEKAAIGGDGIRKYNDEEKNKLIQAFEKNRERLALLKFVPASGAASRMFKALFNFIDTFNPKNQSLDNFLQKKENKEMKIFFEHLKDFPFYDLVDEKIRDSQSSDDEYAHQFVQHLLSSTGLNYGQYPKGLLPFHQYNGRIVTPFEEHLHEAANYAHTEGMAKLHFTISEQHRPAFSETFKDLEDYMSKMTKICFEVNYSYQKASTDTIAVTMENEPFRNSDGSLLFRPGGHGALIANLNEQDADIIFIKNIDNVVVPKYADQITKSKELLAGLLVSTQGKTFEYAELLFEDDLTADQLEEIKAFLEEELNVRFNENYYRFNISEQIEILKDKINRPIRVCGMVQSDGDPGGGPFWVRDEHNHISLQIIETAQIDKDNTEQAAITSNATHFNPVDLVCGIKNHKGEKYNLLNFVDKNQGFITEKTKEGQSLKALELPGLWNGAMAYWNTIFVEVPLITFNPVKTVNDLLEAPHRMD